MTIIKLNRKQVFIRLAVLAGLVLSGFVWLCVRACPTWHAQIQVPPEARSENMPTAFLTGGTQETAIAPPAGYARIPAAEDSFLHFMRGAPVWPQGSSIMTYDGKPLSSVNAAAVYTLSLPETDIQQCADTVIRLWSEYFASTGQPERIAFQFSNGYETKYTDWAAGRRYVNIPVIDKTFCIKLAGEDGTMPDYLCQVMRYAGTLSLEAESQPISVSEAHAGDIICKGGAPGHAVLIADEAVNEAGERCFLLTQGFMPAQSAHIIAGVYDSPLGEDCPWYTEEQLGADTIRLSSYTFERGALRRWKEGFPNAAA